MTDLPIDYRRRPWRDKYLDEETSMLNRWVIFGECPDGSVAVSDAQQDIFVNMPKDVANEIIAARDVFVDVVMKHLALSKIGKNT